MSQRRLERGALERRVGGRAVEEQALGWGEPQRRDDVALRVGRERSNMGLGVGS